MNVVKIEVKMEQIWSINEQQVIKIDELDDKMWKFDKPIKNLEMLSAKNNIKEEIEPAEAAKKKW